MTTHTLFIILAAGVGVALLAILILRLGKRLAMGLLILGGLIVGGTAALSLLTQAQANRQTAIAAQQAAQAAQTAAAGQAMTGAALSIILFLVILLLILVLGAVGVAFAWRWWQRRQRYETYLETMHQAQAYAALQGRQMRPPTRRSYPPMLPPAYPTQAPPVILVGHQAQPYPPYPTYTYPPAAQPEVDAYTGFLPPDEGWEVVE